MSQTLTSTPKTATRYVRCPWVFVNLAKVDAWEVNPERLDPRYHATSVTHAFERACGKAGVTHVTCRDLQHTFDTNMRRRALMIFGSWPFPGIERWRCARDKTIDEADWRPAVNQLAA
jgi:integrase